MNTFGKDRCRHTDEQTNRQLDKPKGIQTKTFRKQCILWTNKWDFRQTLIEKRYTVSLKDKKM